MAEDLKGGEGRKVSFSFRTVGVAYAVTVSLLILLVTISPSRSNSKADTLLAAGPTSRLGHRGDSLPEAECTTEGPDTQMSTRAYARKSLLDSLLSVSFYMDCPGTLIKVPRRRLTVCPRRG